jgi:hypothetical protein
MAVSPAVAKAARIKVLDTKIYEILGLIAKLDANQGITVDANCVYDIGAQKGGPGGVGGQYLQQCRNFAIDGSNPPMCTQHVRKSLLNLLVEAQTKKMQEEGTPVRTTVRNVGVYDPRSVLVTLQEYDDYVKNATTCTPAVPGQGVEGAIFGRADAICKAFKDL